MWCLVRVWRTALRYHVGMLSVAIAVLLIVGIFLALSFALSRETREVESARDTEYVELDGSWVHYRIAGAGPPVVLVHGWLSSSRVWEPLAKKLAQNFTVYMLDLPGFGGSDKPLSGYGLRPGSRLLHAFCAEFGITDAAVVGHDIGGDMAVKLAADYPDAVRKLVLVAAPAKEDHIDLPTSLWLATAPVVGPVFYVLGRSLQTLRRWWMRSFVSNAGDLPRQAVEDAGRSTPAAVGQSLKAVRRELSRDRLVRQARRVKAPLLVVSGEEDQIVDPDAARVWAEIMPESEALSIEGCGHLPMAEEPAAFEDRVLSYLEGRSGALQNSRNPEALSAPGTTGPSSEDRPMVHRKRSGSYTKSSGRGTEPDAGAFADAPASGEPAGNGNRSYPSYAGRNRKTRDFVPELPKDLFQWPDAQGSFRRKPGNDPAAEPTGETGGEDLLGEEREGSG